MPAPDAPIETPSTSSRSRKLISGILTSFASRGLAAAVPLAMIPLTLPVLGPSLFGVWMAIISVTAMLIWADLGLGSGLLTRLSGHIAREDHARSRQDLLGTYALVGSMALLLLGIGTVSAYTVEWPGLLGADPARSADVTRVLLVCLWCFGLNMPLSLIIRVQYAAGQVSLSNAFTASGPLTSLALTGAAVWTRQGPEIVVLCATVGPLIANLAASLWFFRRNPHLWPSLQDRHGARPLELLSLGLVFVLLSACSAFALNLDSLIVARLLGSEAVTSFSVPFRIMAALGLLINLVNLPLWPANANALAQGDVTWVLKTTRRMAVLSGCFVMGACGILLLAATPITELLSRGVVNPDLRVFLALGGWWTVVAWTSPFMMVQNAAGVLRWQLAGWLIFLAVAIPLKVLGIATWGAWAGPALGAVAYLLIVIPLNQYGYRRATLEAQRPTVETDASPSRTTAS